MKAYKCDICEQFYCDEDDRNYQVTKWNWLPGLAGLKGSYEPLDLCPDCYADFLAGMKMRKVAMTGKAAEEFK